MTSRDRARGCLLGLATGDALGRPVEFESREEILEGGKVTEMRANGTWEKPAGTVTDDTEMALCIARSLVERDGFDPDDIADRFVDWYRGGPFDIGGMTRRAINRLLKGDGPDEAGHAVWESSPEGTNAGNGSVMRCAPYAIAFRDDRERLIEVSMTSSAITHADPRCTWGCATLNLVLARLITGSPIGPSLLELDAEVPEEIDEAFSGLRKRLDGSDSGTRADELENGGYVVTTLEAGLYHGLVADSTEEAIVEAVNMGGDTDTLGAVGGAVAGARFGARNIPERWLREIGERDELEELADGLLELDS